MVYSACVEWLNDWTAVDPPLLLDEWDLSHWMDTEMRQAIETFIQYGFHSPRGRNDAIMILRALVYEYFLFRQQNAIHTLKSVPDAAIRLPALPQSNQKSAAWHAETREMLSGHEFGSVCVGTVAERGSVVAKKCGPPMIVTDEDIESRTVFLTSEDGSLSAFKWGWRYEPVARDVFERCVAQGIVFDGLGRIRHTVLPRLGASPDGLIMDGPRCGRLVEIKCPPTRPLNGSIPIRYYCQMQLQAEVCDVEAVEYVEIQFGAAQQHDYASVDILAVSKNPWLGKICVTAQNEDTQPQDYKYAYSPLFPSTKEGLRDCLAWTPFPSEDEHKGIIHESSIWYVKDWFTKTVPRNRQWFAVVGKPAYEAFWVEVEEARKDGRYKPRLLGFDDSSEGSVHEAHDIGVGGEKKANGAKKATRGTGAGIWIGGESDPEEGQGNTA